MNEWVSVLKDTSEKTQFLLYYSKTWELGLLTKTHISRLLSLLEILIYLVSRGSGGLYFLSMPWGFFQQVLGELIMECSLIRALLTLLWRRLRFSSGKSLSIRMSRLLSLVKLLIVNKVNASGL